MIRHIVLIRFRKDVPEETISGLFNDLCSIRDKLPGLLDIQTGRSESPEKIERGFLHGFTADFADWSDLQAYQEHEDHKRVGAALVAHAEGGIDGILVFDYVIRGQKS